ncbi:DUF3433 domain-containing protein [Aspergillus fischeri NRRL 181]|uniref:Uncharacterized protein n=1 Tax=Neosartorya fischeri (strain ATCC 1020 / DSM 3700 / CBS 544.65 / FGSC A1164 / JCM 1740 / NRRL 181 / WB 181) TaxID=331117 RepID=A1DJA9_NEOFI|nr:uncharacterized protein NFIA_001470 [Aspergillus fischeri NRRL 181]EAW16798.1 hypothetical protein NFIA_001470 [Aspergillus fischeri NRRL 181]
MVAKDSNHRSAEGQKQDQNDGTAAQDRGWMPSSLQAPFLCSQAALFFLLSIALECLRQYSDRNQGLVIFKTAAELPKSVSVAYIYIPTAVAVLAVTLWNFSASDVLRLEPYFQLAKAEGVAATVLFTSYSFCYGLMAPLVAARNRHWLVFFTSSLSILMRIFLPSLLSGVVVLTEVTTTESISVLTWPDLLDVDTQKAWLSSETFRPHANASVKITVDDVFLLRSSDYATAAVSMPLDENDTSLLSLNQTVYWAELACQDVALRDLEPPDRGVFRNISGMEFPSLGDGNAASTCYVDVSLGNITANRGASSQVRYWEPAHSKARFHAPVAFRTRGCRSVALFGILLDLDMDVHGTSDPGPSNATAFACTATYTSAEAELLISVNGSIAEVKVHPSTERSLTSTGFAHEEFQDLLFSGYHSNPLAKVGTPNAVAADGIDPPRASNSTAGIHVAQYQDAITQLWKQKFITTMSKLFNPTATPTKVDARQATRVVALAIISRTALMAESILLAAVVLLLLLAVLYPRRLNFLRGDPGSIAAQCGIIADLFPSDTVLARFDAQFHRATTRQLRRWSKNFRCEWAGKPSERKVNIVPLGRPLDSEVLALPATRRGKDPRPHFLVPHWFLVECALLTGILVSFGLALSSLRVNDINDVSPRELALTILLIYGPTVVSSVISSLLESVLRHLSVLEPWVRLQRGMASATDSLALNYGSQTPIAVLRKSGRGAPLLLTILSVTCVLDLLLNVLSGGIFEPRLKEHRTPASGLLSAQYNDTVFHAPAFEVEFDGYGLTLSSLTTGAPLLPWTTPDYSFLPLTVNESDYNSFGGVSYSAITLGVGASLECHHIPINNSWTDSEAGKVFWNHTTSSGVNCTAEVRNSGTDGDLIRRSIAYLLPTVDSPVTPCQTSIFILARWATENPAPITSQNSLALYCTPSIQINEFEALASIGQKKFPTHRDSSFYQYDWPGLLTAFAYEPSNPTLDSLQPEFLIRAAQSTYREIFSSYLTLARNTYFDRYRSSERPAVDGTIITKLWGMMPSTPSMVIVIVLLSIDISVLILVFALRRNNFDGPRIPKSVGSLIPWVARSRIAPDFRGASRMTDSEQRDNLMQRSHKYTFGLSLCPDGEERWLLDYDSRYLKEEDHELDEICGIID